MASFYEVCDRFEYLDELRASGAVNMFGAAPLLAQRFDLEIKEARKVLASWQETFSDEPLEDRVSVAQQRAAS